jgi:hypothetical protein
MATSYPSDLTVKATLNGTEYTLTWDDINNYYTATLTAPGATSFNRDGHSYPIDIVASNSYGATATASTKISVYETIAPTIGMFSPTEGTYYSTNTPTFLFNVIDEDGGSGVNRDATTITIDGTEIDWTDVKTVTNGYSYTVEVPNALINGAHKLVVYAEDFDGNDTTQTINFTVDVTPPQLNLYSPENDLKTNAATLLVKGATNDSTSSTVNVTITVKCGSTTGKTITPTVASDGTFSYTLTSADGYGSGTNTITVTSTDLVGNATTVTRTVYCDTSHLTIESAEVSSNVVPTSSTVVLTVKIVSTS